MFLPKINDIPPQSILPATFYAGNGCTVILRTKEAVAVIFNQEGYHEVKLNNKNIKKVNSIADARLMDMSLIEFEDDANYVRMMCTQKNGTVLTYYIDLHFHINTMYNAYKLQEVSEEQARKLIRQELLLFNHEANFAYSNAHGIVIVSIEKAYWLKPGSCDGFEEYPIDSCGTSDSFHIYTKDHALSLLILHDNFGGPSTYLLNEDPVKSRFSLRGLKYTPEKLA